MMTADRPLKDTRLPLRGKETLKEHRPAENLLPDGALLLDGAEPT